MYKAWIGGFLGFIRPIHKTCYFTQLMHPITVKPAMNDYCYFYQGTVRSLM